MKRFFKKAFSFERMVGLVMLIALMALSRLDPFPVEFLREKSFDIYQQLKPRPITKPADSLVTIIDIDERSLQEVGQWPWSRKTVAQLVVNLHNLGVAVTAFDIVFSEPDRLNPSKVVDGLVGIDEEVRQKILKLESNDAILGRIVGQANVVLGQAGYWDQLPNKAGEPFYKSVAIKKLAAGTPEPTDFLNNIPTLIRNLPILEKGAKGVGLFSLNPSLDGIIREVPMISKHNDSLYPALSVEAIRVGFAVSTLMAEVDPYGIKAIGVAPKSKVKPKGLKIATNENGMVRPYFARHNQGLYVSAADVLNGTVDKSRIAGKIAFVGTSAVGLLDIRSTPIDPFIPGVEVHAQIIENALAIDRELGAVVSAEQFLSRPNIIKGGEILIIAFGGLLMIVLTPMLGATRSLLVFVVLSASAVAASWYMFSEQKVLLDATFTVVSTFLLYSTLTYMNFTREEAAKRQTRDAFSKYLSPDMVNVVAENPDQLKLGGQKRDMTLLFCDVRGFTTISEQFDAEGLTKLINKLLTPLTNVILARRGTVDKYMGDCIMAFWNAPLDDKDHARHACLSALAMLEEMQPLNDRLEAEAKEEGRKHIPLKVGVGLNSGECVVGNMGSDQRFDYSVLGDTVNLASRLEGQSKAYGVRIVIGEPTALEAPDMAVIELDLIKVKGKTQAVRIFSLLGDETVAALPEFQAFKTKVDEMLAKYRGQDWAGAKIANAEARELGKVYEIDGFFDLYDERIAESEANPPGPDWDGVFVATSK